MGVASPVSHFSATAAWGPNYNSGQQIREGPVTTMNWRSRSARLEPAILSGEPVEAATPRADARIQPHRRVLIVIQNVSFSYDTRMQKVADSLAGNGYAVLVISPRYACDTPRRYNGRIESWHYPMPHIRDGVVGHLLEYSYSLMMITAFSLVALLRRGCNVVHLCSPPDILFPLAALFRGLGRRVIVDIHDLSPELAKVRYRLRETSLLLRAVRFAERAMLLAASEITTTTESQKTVLAERHGIPAERISVVRNGIDLATLRMPLVDTGAHEPTIGYLGTMNPQDGVEGLLHAIRHVRHVMKRKDIRFKIIGDGGAFQSLLHLAATLDLGDSITFTGRLMPREALSQLMTCDVCVQPDPKNEFTDTCCMVKMLEYMALGKAVVAFKLRETELCCGRTVVYAETNSTIDLACKLVTLVDDGEARRRLGTEARRRLEENFTWPLSESVLLGVYRRVSHVGRLRQRATK